MQPFQTAFMLFGVKPYIIAKVFRITTIWISTIWI